MRNAVAVTAMTIMGVLVSGCSSGPSEERLIDAVDERAYKFVKVVEVEVHDAKEFDDGGRYLVEFDYTVEFQESYDSLLQEARAVGNLPLFLTLGELEPFDEGDERTIEDVRGSFHKVVDGVLRFGKPNKDRERYEYLDMEKDWVIAY